MHSGAFDFPGARNVTTVNIQHNDFLALPEKLLWNMTSIEQVFAQQMPKLETLPEDFFKGQSRLRRLSFAGSTNLGARIRLPDGLFKGLVSLTHLELEECRYQNMPNMDDLGALLEFRGNVPSGDRGLFRMDANESESMFDALGKVSTMELQSNSLTSVPSIKNMRELTTLLLATNKITMIRPGDFAGAEKLFVMSLDNNGIVSVAAEAFLNLGAFRVLPAEFNPLMADGTPYVNAYGLGIWRHPHTGRGFFGGNQSWGFIPIGFSPNPVECVWVGPNVSEFECKTCVLGYETTSTNDTTCIQPEFRPHKGWAASSGSDLLEIQDAQRANGIERGASTSTPILLTGQTYTIPAPLLEPKERMFVGYAQPYTSIRYELDFTRGAEVDIGCGTAVVGNAARDQKIPKDAFNFSHPLSMYRNSYQWPGSQVNLNAVPIDPGTFPNPCPRFHRFSVKHAGNFTFDACASSMTVGLNIYKRTDNLSESQPRMTSDWPREWKQWQRLPFEVPLHDNDQQYATVSTGLIKVQPDIVNKRHTDWLIRLSSPDFPPYLYADPASHTAGSVNGCPLSLSANRTYYIAEAGDYVLQTQGATLIQSCDNFAVKMTCSGGAETASPADRCSSFSLDLIPCLLPVCCMR